MAAPEASGRPPDGKKAGAHGLSSKLDARERLLFPARADWVSSIVRYGYLLAHVFYCALQLFHQILAIPRSKGEAGVLISAVDGFAHVQVYFRTVLDENFRHHRCALFLSSSSKNSSDTVSFFTYRRRSCTTRFKVSTAFRHKIHPVHVRNGRDLRIYIIQRHVKPLSPVPVTRYSRWFPRIQLFLRTDPT